MFVSARSLRVPFAQLLVGFVASSLVVGSLSAQGARVAQYGNQVPGSVGLPSLVSDALPAIGGASNLRIHNGVPGAGSVMLMGFDMISLPVFGLELLVDPVLADFPMPLMDPLGASQIALPIPPDPTLQGVQLTFQSFLLDAGAPGPLPLSQTGGLLWELDFPGVLPPPLVTGVFPPFGTEGDVIQIVGQGFDPDPRNNCVFIGDFDARAMVVAASPTMLTAVLGPTAFPAVSGEVRVARGSGLNITESIFDDGAIKTFAEPAMLLVEVEGVGNVNFQLGVTPSGSVRGVSVGAGTLSFGMQGSWSGNFVIDIYVRDGAGNLTKDVHIPVSAVGMSFDECVAHIRAHLKSVLPDVTVTGSASSGTIVMTDPSFGGPTTGYITG